MHQLLLFSSVDLSFVLETLRREALADGDESQVFLRSVASSTCRGFVSRRHLLDLLRISSVLFSFVGQEIKRRQHAGHQSVPGGQRL